MSADVVVGPPGPGEISFHTTAGEVLRLTDNAIYHRGKLLTTDAEIVEGLRDFLNLHLCARITES
jgi:hypothetical protein